MISVKLLMLIVFLDDLAGLTFESSLHNRIEILDLVSQLQVDKL